MDTSSMLRERISNSIQISRSREKINSAAQRVQLLKKLSATIIKYSESIISILEEELGREKYDTMVFELLPLKRCIKYLIKNIGTLSAEKRVRGSWLTWPARFYTVREPYGTVLVYSCWNYPFLLALEPVAGAVAAGNRVVLKISDRGVRSAALVKKIVNETFPDDTVICVQDELENGELAAMGFDYLFCTGSRKTAEELLEFPEFRLVPSTFELGGKNPCIVDIEADPAVAAKKIVWGKFTNSGQSCIAPDYILVNKKIKDDFIRVFVSEIRKKYGDDPVSSRKCRIIDRFSYDRLSAMMNSGRLACGGEKNPDDLCIAPCVIDRLVPDDPLLCSEVFGPVMGIVEFEDDDSLLKMLRRNPDPLAVYCFGCGRERTEKVKRAVRSGAFCINDCLIQFINTSVPFGGVGSGGKGVYHGRWSFETFTYTRSIVKQSRFMDLNLRYKGCFLKEKILGYILKR